MLCGSLRVRRTKVNFFLAELICLEQNTLPMRINATLTDKTQGEKYINCLPFSIDTFIQTNSTIIYALQLITLSLLFPFMFSINME